MEAIFEVTHCEHLAKQLKRTNFAYRRHLNSTGTSQEGHVCSGVRDFSLAWGSLEDLARRASPCGAWATPSGLQASPVTWGTPVHLPGFSSHEAPVRLPLRHLLWSEECSQNSAPREVLPEQCFRNSAPMGLVPCELSTRESCPGSRVRTVLVQGASLSGMPWILSSLWTRQVLQALPGHRDAAATRREGAPVRRELSFWGVETNGK